jgi:hypothetical protein
MGSGYQTTNYGYAGSNSYRPNMGRNIMMGAGVGLLAGMGTYYMFSRMNSYPRCRSGSYSGNCQGCHQQHGSSCTVEPPDQNAHRIELMNTGFWPEDFVAPFVLKITQIANNPDYAAAVVCPPTGADMSTWTGTAADLFFTLSAVAELAEAEAADEEEDGGGGGVAGLLVTLCCCCGICLAIGFCAAMFMRQRQQSPDMAPPLQQQYGQQYGQPQYTGGPQYGAYPQSGVTPVVMGQAVPMDQSYGQPQYGQPQYGQPVYAQNPYGQGQPVMAQAVVVSPGPTGGGYRPGMAATQ